MVLGAMFLWFSFYGFNVGSARSSLGKAKLQQIHYTLINTTLSACSGALTAVLVFYI